GARNGTQHRLDELVADDVVIHLEQHAERRDDEDVLCGPPLEPLGTQRSPGNDADPGYADHPDRDVEEEVGAWREPYRAGKNHSRAHLCLQKRSKVDARTTWAPWPQVHSRPAALYRQYGAGFLHAKFTRRTANSLRDRSAQVPLRTVRGFSPGRRV